MENNYLIEQRILGPRLQIKIDKVRYEELAKCRQILLDALAFEQRYEILLGNFISMEMALTEISLRATLESKHQYSELAENLRQADRHIINILTAIKSNIDQVPQDFKCLSPSTEFSLTAKHELRRLFERSQDYRFIYELRNHVQHKATAIHGFEGESMASNEPNGWVEATKFLAYKNNLSLDKDFKPRVLDEQPEKIDLRRCLRLSVYELGATHIDLRKAVDPHITQARSLFNDSIKEYRTNGANSVIGLCARCVEDTNSDIPIFLDWDDVRLQLVTKNSYPPQLWPTSMPTQPTSEEILSFRTKANQSQAEAASTVFVSTDRWRDYEEGFAMPQSIFILYQLQTGLHPTHFLKRRDSDS